MAGSNVYFRFATQRRYPFDWHGGAGGVLRAQPNGAVLELGSDFGAGRWPAFARTRASDHQLGDWPLVRPQGPEPVGALSTNERTAALALAAAGAAFLLWRASTRRRRAGRRRR